MKDNDRIARLEVGAVQFGKRRIGGARNALTGEFIGFTDIDEGGTLADQSVGFFRWQDR